MQPIHQSPSNSANDLYLEPVLREVARALSWEDREPFSKTYGSFDRTFWGWKFTDFAGARFQEGVYTLAHLYTHPAEDNPCYQHARVLEWALAGMRNWTELQYGDGSFDEAYPFEHSLAATAFTGFYVGEAYGLLKERVPADLAATVERTLRRAGDWLCRNDEHHGVLSNHLAAAAAALSVIGRITGDARYAARCQHFLQRIYSRQSPEGWYEEYGGADPGYQTHGTFYMARIWQATQDPALLDSLRRSIAFLKHFIHPNATLGGAHGSRNTEFYFPAGFEILATVLPDAAAIAIFMRAGIATLTGVGLSAMDAYNFFPILNNYLFAAAAAKVTSSVPALPFQAAGNHDFPDAGLYVRSTAKYFAVVGLSKGGVYKIYDKVTGTLRVADCGYWARHADGRVSGSQRLRRPTPAGSGRELNVTSDFAVINQRVLNPWVFIGFRLFTLTLGRVPAAALWVKNLLVNVLVSRRKDVALRLVRKFTFAEDRVTVDDHISGAAAGSVTALHSGEKFATIHMGSSRYFQREELACEPIGDPNGLAQLRATGACVLNRRIEVKTNPTG